MNAVEVIEHNSTLEVGLIVFFSLMLILMLVFSTRIGYDTIFKKHFNKKLIGEGKDHRIVESNYNYTLQETIDEETGDIILNIIANQPNIRVIVRT